LCKFSSQGGSRGHVDTVSFARPDWTRPDVAGSWDGTLRTK
jgi:hypothetical protein